jgi:hypothetical protein
MYPFILALHNIIRWIVLILGVVAAGRAFIGWFGKKEWAKTDRLLGMFFGIGMDLQLLAGLLLYFFFSPITTAALRDFGSAMKVNDLRFFAVEHAAVMVLAVVFAHLGSTLAKKAPAATAKFQRAAIFFTLAVLCILAAMPWARPLLPHF